MVHMLDFKEKTRIPAILVALLLAFGCIEEQSSPDLGPCAEPPEGVSWEFGQVGIGTCIASPSDLKIRPDPLDPDNYFVVVVNSNSRSNFSGSSVLSVDASSIDLSCPANGMHELQATALTMQEFAGRIDFEPRTGLEMGHGRSVPRTAVGHRSRVLAHHPYGAGAVAGCALSRPSWAAALARRSRLCDNVPSPAQSARGAGQEEAAQRAGV